MAEGDRLDRITSDVIGSAIEVHRSLGPGLLESAYEACLVHELGRRGRSVQRQKPLQVRYREIELDCGYRLDLLVEEQIIVEVKSVEAILPIHKAQLLSYLRLTGCRVGLLINFNVCTLKDGLVRMVNAFPDSRRSPRSRR